MTFAGLKFRYHKMRDRWWLRLPPRAEHPFMTHLPVLFTLARALPIARALEFGSGEISTGAFLNKEWFPRLESLDSYENDGEWAARVEERFGGDTRLNLRRTTGPMSTAAAAVDVELYDLIFIDDSAAASERAATIRAVAAKSPQRAIVVIHDFEELPYRIAAEGFKSRARVAGLTPNTGVAANHARMPRRALTVLERTLRQRGEQKSAADYFRLVESLGAQAW